MFLSYASRRNSVLALLMVQLGTGIRRLRHARAVEQDAPQPMAGIVFSTVSHVAGGALLLATSVILAIQTRRMITVHAPNQS